MQMANAARLRACCKGRTVGAVIVVDDRIVATGYNGVPRGMLNCTDGGCWRCRDKNRFSGRGYDVCICVHAEANALASAAKFGPAVSGGTCYSTLQPCFSCAKELLQAGVKRLVYGTELPYDDEELQAQYNILVGHFGEGSDLVEIDPARLPDAS